MGPARWGRARVSARGQSAAKPRIAPAGAGAIAAGPGVPRAKPPVVVRPAGPTSERGSGSTAVAARPSSKAALRPVPAPAGRATRAVTPAAAAGKPIPGPGPRVVLGSLITPAAPLFLYCARSAHTA